MKKYYNHNIIRTFLIITILLVAFLFRVNGINWDQNQHLHPDERFLTMVTNDTTWPDSFSQYLDPDTSTLNPYNAGYSFFVYGTFPLVVVKYASQFIVFDDYPYNNITLVGRLMSALVDVATVYLVYKIGQKVFGDKAGLIASFIYATSVLPIQLSHFYAVDTFVVFFVMLSFFFLVNYTFTNLFFYTIMGGISYGLAIATKVSSLYIFPFLTVLFVFVALKRKSYMVTLFSLFAFIAFAHISLRLADPRIFTNHLFDFTINPLFIENIRQLKSYNKPDIFFPPAIQWIKTKAYIFPLTNMFFWGLGIPLFVLMLLATLASISNILSYFYHNRLWSIFSIRKINNIFLFQVLMTAWVIILFLYQGQQFTKALRYFLIIYPFLALLSGHMVMNILSKLSIKEKTTFIVTLVFILLIWPVSFSSIYAKKHTRITASEWIYANVPAGSVISCEYWDDCLPVSIGGKNNRLYITQTLHLFDKDSPNKWESVNRDLQQVDYLILSSNRLWGSITKVPELYPISSKFYEDLFDGKLQFIKVAEFVSYPTIPFVNIEINDTSSDETFTVYDHPTVMIFKRY